MKHPRSYYLERAQRAIANDRPVIYEVASSRRQIAGNVKHMPWFIEAVADELEFVDTLADELRTR